MTEQHYINDSELDVLKICGGLKPLFLQYKYWMGLTPLFFILFGFVVLNIVPPEWQSSAIVQIGKLPRNDNSLQRGNMELIEPVDNVIARMGTSEFQDSILGEGGVPLDSGDAFLFKSALSARQIKTTNLIEIKSRGLSKVKALNLISLTAKRIQDIHANLSSPTVENIRLQVENTDKVISGINQTLGKSKGLSSSADALPEIMATYLLTDLVSRRLSALDLINLATNAPTAVMGVNVSGTPVYPRKRVWIILFGIAGFLLL